jgi:S-adenosyl methyltransferase
VTDDDVPGSRIDTSVPHSARVWNYWLGGKDNYPVDREAGDRYREAYPQIEDIARAGRYFLARAVRFLAADAGVRQFIDVGTGLPTPDNTHEIAQRVAPECRVVYVDNDPLVLAHARALLTPTPQGSCDYIDADMRDTDAIVAAAAQTLDLTQPVAVLFIGVLGHIADYGESRAVVAGLLGGVPAGSYLVVGESVGGQARAKANELYNRTGAVPYTSRTVEQVEGYFAGLDLVSPGVVPVGDWRPDPSPFPPARLANLAAVGRKPLDQ